MTSSSTTPRKSELAVYPTQQQHSQTHGRVPSPSTASGKQSLQYDAHTMQQQMEAFLVDGIYDSAQLLGEFLIANAMTPTLTLIRSELTMSDSLAAGTNDSNQQTTSSQEDENMDEVRNFHAKSLRLFADLLVCKREYKRAIQYYKKYWKLKMINTNANPTAAEVTEAVAVKCKIADCWIRLENPHQAIEALHSIASSSRTLRVNLMLGRLYLHEGLKNKAEECYTMALRQNPYALEATLALTDLAALKETSSTGVTGDLNTTTTAADPSNSSFRQREIERFYVKLSTLRPSNKVIARVDASWMQTLVNAHMNAKRGRYRASMEAFDALEKVFPNNLHCLLYKGKLEMDQEFYHQAHLNFHRARQVDDQNLTMMDAHADCLRRNGARTQLNNLVHDLFETSDNHAEPWLAAAYYSEMKGENETALQFCERAIMTERRYAPAHLFRGSLLLQLQRPEYALIAFTTSCKLTKTLEAYAGMITSYCDLCAKGVNKYKEAMTTAKSVVKLFPQKAQSFTLLGMVFALRPENKEHARKAFQKALSMEPRKLPAIFGLVDLLLSEGNFTIAIEKLLALAEQNAREEVFTKLADVYALNKQFAEAMTHYHHALSLNPTSSEAMRGVDRLEKLMRGEDPDELNTTMEIMEHEDSIEAGDYITA